MQSIDLFARDLPRDRQASVHGSAKAGTEKRRRLLGNDYPDPDALRRLAARIKQHTLDHLDTYLEQSVAALQRNGVQVHFAPTAEDARRTVRDILRAAGARSVMKSKSMAAEEIHLNDFLAADGLEVLETDLGEFIVQLDGDVPSHIVKPILHKNRREIAETLLKNGIAADYNDDPETITRRARRHMRGKFMAADAGITGGNFLVAESGRLVLITNEGNSRFGMAPNRLHIALVGIEKLLPRDRDLAVFLNLLGRSATAQQLTVYTEFITGPKPASQPSGPVAMHVVLMDNGRSDVLASNCREILRCIRCGSCQNVCPVYRQASGHAYRATYGGPVGAVLSPLLAGDRFLELADLPKASSLCGACREVCPVDIPIPDLLLRLRDKAKSAHVPSGTSVPMGPFAFVATSPRLWRSCMSMSRAVDYLPLRWIPVGLLQGWVRRRSLPPSHGGEFRKWWAARRQAPHAASRPPKGT